MRADGVQDAQRHEVVVRDYGCRPLRGGHCQDGAHRLEAAIHIGEARRAPLRFQRQTGLDQGGFQAAPPPLRCLRSGRPRQECDACVIQVEQMPRRAVHAGLQIHHDAADIRQIDAMVDHDHRRVHVTPDGGQIIERQPGTAGDDPADRLADQDSQALRLSLGIFGGVEQERQIVAEAGLILDAPHDFREVGIENVRDQQGDGVPSERERRRGVQCLIAEMVDRREDALADGGADGSGLVQDARHRRR